MDWAALRGYLEVVQWLHENRTEGCTDKAMDYAAMNGQLHVVKWLHVNRREGCTVEAMNRAAENGHLHIVRWLQQNCREGSAAFAMPWAIREGHFDVVLFLHAHRSEIFSFPGTNYPQQPCGELTQWVLHNYSDKVDGRSLEVPNSDWRFNEWCGKVNLRRARGNIANTCWICDSASLRLEQM
ncbi:hypothetical protein PF007_g14222 [Phytophthora fragariae]|nr:hypothetical protein PF007_g14222 [Phytophthora fragariae]